MSRFLLAVGLVAVAAKVGLSQPPLAKPPSLRVKVPAKPFDPKAKPVKLTEAEAKALVTEMADPDENKRLTALLRVAPGTPDSVVEAVLGRLGDPYFEERWAFDAFERTHVIRGVAAECVVHLGPTVVPLLLKFAKDDANRAVRDECVGVIGRLGHTADSEKWLRELLEAGRKHDRAILDAAEAWGKSGAGLLRLLVANPKAVELDRSHAMNALGKCGDPMTDAKLLRPFLASDSWEFRAVAVMALGNLRDAESVPAFEKMARDPKEENHIRHKATERALTMLGKAEGEKLLLDVVKTADGMLMGYVARQVAERKLAPAVPFLLTGLGDRYTHTRESADQALRALTGRPDGVGYDPQKGNADVWRDVIEKK